MKGFFALSEVQKEAPTGLIPKCGSCGLFKSCDAPKMKPHGDGARKVLIVGETPEEGEERPFTGKAGQLLREHLAKIGVRLDRDAVSTNALICSPGEGKINEKAVGWCHPNLLKTIKEYEPQVIIPLGQKAVKSVLRGIWKDEVGELERWVGWKIPYEKFWICPTYHPGFVRSMHNSLIERQFSNHLEAAFAIDEELPEFPQFEKEVEIIYDDVKAARALREIDEEGGWVSFDYEGNCLKPEYPDSRIVSAAVCNGRRTISYPWVGRAVEASSIFLRSKRTKKIASNAKFEERWTLVKLGHPVTNWGWCTVQAAHCLDNREGICSLKFLSFVKLGIETYNAHIDPYLKSDKNTPNGWYNRIGEIELGQLLLYGGIDAYLEHRLAMVQRKEMGFRD